MGQLGQLLMASTGSILLDYAYCWEYRICIYRQCPPLRVTKVLETVRRYLHRREHPSCLQLTPISPRCPPCVFRLLAAVLVHGLFV
jgi:hypothetical protein